MATAAVSSMMLSILLFGDIAINTGIGQPHVKYLKGVQRLNTGGYTDYYFCCNCNGDFLQWVYNNEPLRGFTYVDAGLVVVIARSMYQFTATLLSSHHDPETNQRRLDSVLVLSFTGDHPSSFEVTCGSNSEFNTTRVDGMHGNAISSSSSNGEVVLNHIISTEIVQNKNKTHIFICGTDNDQQYYEIQHDLTIAFTEYDKVGKVRTVLSQDGSFVNTQGVLFAQLPYNKTSLLFVTENSDVTVSCYFGTNQAELNSAATVEFTNPPQTSTDIVPVTTMTAGSSVSHATTMLSSTPYETDTTDFVGSSNKKFLILVIACGILGILICGCLIAVVVCITKKAITSKDGAPVSSPQRNDVEGMALGGGKANQDCSVELASSSKHACQISMEETCSEDASDRIYEK